MWYNKKYFYKLGGVEMTKTLHAIFDGKVLCLEEPLELKPNTHVKVRIETISVPHGKKCSFFKTARSLKLEGPVDWSTNLEEHLYGEKRQ